MEAAQPDGHPEGGKRPAALQSEGTDVVPCKLKKRAEEPRYGMHNAELFTGRILKLKISNRKFMKSGSFKSLVIPAAIAAGILSHGWLHAAAPALKYLVALMLFLTFARLELHWRIFRPLHASLVAAQFAVALAAYAVMLPFGPDLAMAAFMAGVTPTATAAPVITALLGGEIGFATAAVIGSNLATALIVPFLLPLLVQPEIPHAGAVPVWRMLAEVLGVIALPLLASQLLRRFLPAANERLGRFQPASFFLWAAVLAIVCAKSAHFLMDGGQKVQPSILGALAGMTAAVCAVNFTLGRLLGGRRFSLEAGQALGQKNTAFTIWIALTFINPLAALGPTFYVVWHNLFNSWQLWRRHRK